MIKLTTTESRHLESTLEYLIEVIGLDDEQIIPEDLIRMAQESLLIISSANVYTETQMLEEALDEIEA